MTPADRTEARLLADLVRAHEAMSMGRAPGNGGGTSPEGLGIDFDALLEAGVSTDCAHPYRGLEVDVWMADGVDELAFAAGLLQKPHMQDMTSSGVLPRWDQKSGTSFLFVPLSWRGRRLPEFFALDEGSNGPMPCGSDLDEAAFGGRGEMRIVVFPSSHLKDRCVLLCQIRSDLVEFGGPDPVVDAARNFFSCAQARYVLFLSPQPSQFGVLKPCPWWDGMAETGRFHQVLCNLHRLERGPHDASDPCSGALANFNRLGVRFYPDSWRHVIACHGLKGGVRKGDLRLELLSPVDEGPYGRLKAYRTPLPLEVRAEEVVEGEIPVDGMVKLAFLRASLRAEEDAILALCDGGGQERRVEEHSGLLSALHAEFQLRYPRRASRDDGGVWDPLRDYLLYYLARRCEAKLMAGLRKKLERITTSARGGPGQDFVVEFFNKAARQVVNLTAPKGVYLEYRRRAEAMVKALDLAQELERRLGPESDFEKPTVLEERDMSLLEALSSRQARKKCLLDADFSQEVSRRLAAAVKDLVPGERCAKVAALRKYVCRRIDEASGLPEKDLGDALKKLVADGCSPRAADVLKDVSRLSAEVSLSLLEALA